MQDDHDYGAIEEEALEDEQPEEQGASEEEGEEENGVARPLGPFMTPQPSAVRASSVFSNQSGLSLQGPQRIRVVQPWKVKDIVVPPPSKPGVKQEDLEPKEEVSEEEKSVRAFAVLHFLHYIDFLSTNRPYEHDESLRSRRQILPTHAFPAPDACQPFYGPLLPSLPPFLPH